MKKYLTIISLLGLAGVLVLSANSSMASEVTGTLNTGVQTGVDGTVVTAPSALPAAGTYNSTQSVVLTAAGSSGICYTTDGTTPACSAAGTSCTTGTLYSSAISISSSATLQAKSCYPNSNSSSVASSAYSLVCATASVSNGSVAAYPSCTITCNSGYTLSGSSCVANTVVSGGGGGGITLDTTPPTNISVTINSGATSTDSATVVLTLAATDATQMMISSTSTFSGGVWETYSTSKNWGLTGEAGVKTVYAKFRDSAGNTSSAVSDDVILNVNSSLTSNVVSASATTGSATGATTSVSSDTRAQQLQLLATLMNTLKALLVKMKAAGMTIPAGLEQYLGGTPSTTTGTKLSDIKISLTLNSRGEEVKLLQNFLIGQNKGPMASSLSTYGATGFFGMATKNALLEFQKAVGIAGANGVFGPGTKAYLKSIGY